MSPATDRQAVGVAAGSYCNKYHVVQAGRLLVLPPAATATNVTCYRPAGCWCCRLQLLQQMSRATERQAEGVAACSCCSKCNVLQNGWLLVLPPAATATNITCYRTAGCWCCRLQLLQQMSRATGRQAVGVAACSCCNNRQLQTAALFLKKRKGKRVEGYSRDRAA